jgi:predicted  nucleic acid-binding Zn-ribbon protein
MFEEFRVLNFRAHPAIVKELSLFMLTERVDPLEVVKLRGELTTAKEDVKAAKSDVAKVVAENTKLKNQLTNVLEDIRKLKERVSKTEKK